MKKILAATVLMLPSLAFAQSQLNNINDVSKNITSIINIVVYLLIALAVLFIIWNVVMSLIKGDKPDERNAALANIGWGVVGLAIILSIWGLVNIIMGTFKTNTAPGANIPQVNVTTAPTVY
ncbi:MAG: hypothetical protein NTZ38_03405 [Candidatus Taylorbacteria bacterium]|nr:hypothetical protein [Candidatus Taylorbacteria bacterium]